jgi:hypothetical protein
MGGSAHHSGWLAKRRDKDRTSGHALDDQDTSVLGDWLIRPCRERLRPASHGQKYLTGPMFRDRDSDPPDHADQILLWHASHRLPGLRGRLPEQVNLVVVHVSILSSRTGSRLAY